VSGAGRARAPTRSAEPTTARHRTAHGRGADGQAAVELALALPVVVVLLLGMLQVALVARDQLAVEMAAREAARAAAVSAEPGVAARSAAERATSLRPLSVTVSQGGDTVTVSVGYTSRTDVAMIGRLVGDVAIRASVTMALEPP